MPTFDYSFLVKAPQPAVLDFHHDTTVLKTLTPPPMFVKIHSFEPLAEGSKADFTLWFGPFPVHWQVVHSGVGASGFTDTQVKGPLKRWRHNHRFTALDERTTLVVEHIDYEHSDGISGLIGRLLFSRPALFLLFTARKLITRREIARSLS